MPFKHFFFGVCYYPEAWAPDRHQSDINRIADAGFNFVRMGEGAWSYWEPEEGHFQFDLFDRVIDFCRQRNVQIILGTPTYACPAWMATKYPEVLRWNYQRIPMRHGSRRNLNYTSSRMLELSDRLCAALADHYRDEPQIIGWQLDNEFNCHMDVSYAPSDTVAFQNWLIGKYGTIDELNRRWGTAFWSQTYSSFDQIDLPHPTATYANPTQLMDESRFISDTVVGFARRQSEILRQRNDRWFITHNGLFSNVDGPALVQELDFFCHDQYPLFFANWQTAAELLTRSRSLSFPFGILEQQAGPGGQMDYFHRTPRRGEMRLWAWQSVCHGANLLSFFRWRTCPYGSEQHWHGLLDADDRDNRRLAEAKTLGVELKRLPADFFSAPPLRVIGVARDFDNEVNDWRVNKYVGEGRTEYRWWVAEAASRHLPVDEFSQTSDWAGYQLLIIPHHKMTDDSFVEKISQFVRAGGSVLLAAQSGSKTSDVHMISAPLPGLLSDLAGVEIDDWTVLPGEEARTVQFDDDGERFDLRWFVERIRPTTAQCLAKWDSDDSLLAEGCAMTVNSVGKGKVYYVGGYCPPAAIAALTDYLMRDLNIHPIVQTSPDVECIQRASASHRYTCLLNHGKTAHPVHHHPAGVDLITGQPIADRHLTLQPLDVVIIESEVS